jgi:GDP-L-fucose synthase
MTIGSNAMRRPKVYVAGHQGMVAQIVRRLRQGGYQNQVLRTRAELDLLDQHAVERFFGEQKPDCVFLAAAKVGGILANNTCRAEFLYQNLMVQTNVIHAAWKNGVKRLLNLGSSCIYPRDCAQPIREEYLPSGPPTDHELMLSPRLPASSARVATASTAPAMCR